MRILTLLLATFSFFQVSGQISGNIKDSNTKEAIPFVNIWVLNQNSGTTSDANGNFSLEKASLNDTLVFSCVGYERSLTPANGKVFYLTQKNILLQEVVVIPPKNSKKYRIDRIDRNSRHSFGNSGYPWIAGRYIPYQESYNDTPFIKKIALTTHKQKKDVSYQVLILSTTSEGFPNQTIHREPIKGYAMTGSKRTEVDLTDYMIKFPKEGLVIAIEWLIIESNKEERKYKEVDAKEWKSRIGYAPSFYTSKLKKGEQDWTYAQGNWRSFRNKKGDSKFSNHSLGFELILSD